MEGGSLGEKKSKCSCRNGPFPCKASSSSTWEVLLTKCESPLCRGSLGWKGNALDCSKSSLASEEPWHPSARMVCVDHCTPPSTPAPLALHSYGSLKAMGGWNTCILVNWVEQKFLKSSSWPGLPALWGYSAQWLEQEAGEAGSGYPGSSRPPSLVQVMQQSRRNRNTENFNGLFNVLMIAFSLLKMLLSVFPCFFFFLRTFYKDLANRVGRDISSYLLALICKTTILNPPALQVHCFGQRLFLLPSQVLAMSASLCLSWSPLVDRPSWGCYFPFSGAVSVNSAYMYASFVGLETIWHHRVTAKHFTYAIQCAGAATDCRLLLFIF